MTDVGSQKSRQLEVKSGSLWETWFDVPADVKPGIYELKLHSGWGDNSAWVHVGRLEVKVPETWPDKDVQRSRIWGCRYGCRR